MSSTLIIVPVEKLQKEIDLTLKIFKKNPGVYVSLDKTYKNIESILRKKRINIDQLFFIDVVTSKKKNREVLSIYPDRLDLLIFAINSFIKEIKGEKFILIDALSTLLIYNNENKVAKFVKELTDYTSKNDIEVIAISPKTKEKECQSDSTTQ